MNYLERECILHQKTAGLFDLMSGITSLFNIPDLSGKEIKNLKKLKLGHERARLLQNSLYSRAKTKEQAMKYLVDFTTVLHERRHWHDYLGTTLGYELFVSYIEYYSRVVMILRYFGQNNVKIKLPLNTSFHSKASRKHHLEYIQHIKNSNLLIKSKYLPFSDIYTDIRSKKPGLTLSLKDIPFIYIEEDKIVDAFLTDVPITGLSLLEASSVLTEYYAIFDTFGLDEANFYMRRFNRPNLWIYSSLINAFMKLDGKMTVELMQSIVSNCLIYDQYSKIKGEPNPSSRFLIFYNELSRLSNIPDTLDSIKEWLISVIRKNGWMEPVHLAKREILHCHERMEYFKKISLEEKNEDNDAIEDFYIYYFFERIKFMEKFANNILYWGSDYLFDIDLPEPPITRISTKKIDKIVFDRSNEIFIRWFFLTDIIKQIFAKPKEEIACPLKSQCLVKDTTCGTLPLSMPPHHPECWFLITACEILAPDWNLA